MAALATRSAGPVEVQPPTEGIEFRDPGRVQERDGPLLGRHGRFEVAHFRLRRRPHFHQCCECFDAPESRTELSIISRPFSRSLGNRNPILSRRPPGIQLLDQPDRLAGRVHERVLLRLRHVLAWRNVPRLNQEYVRKDPVGLQPPDIGEGPFVKGLVGLALPGGGLRLPARLAALVQDQAFADLLGQLRLAR